MAETINGYKEYASKQYVDEMLASAGGATSWNDLADKPFYETEPIEVMLYNKSDVAFYYNDEYKEAYIDEVVISSFGQFVIGEKYTVIWDGVEYKDLVAFDDGAPMIGAAYEDISDELPFCIITYEEDGDVFIDICTRSLLETHSISITTISTQVHKIEDKYLVQSDWNENDPKSAAYVENRPFYYDIQQKPIMPSVYTIAFTATETTGDSGETLYMANIGEHFGSIKRISNCFTQFLYEWGEYYGTPMFYSFDGVEYSLVESDYNDMGATYSITFGNPKLRNSSKDDNGEHMYVSFWSPADYNHYANIYVADNKPHTISFYTSSISAVKKLDSEFLDGQLIGFGDGAGAEVFNDHESNVASGENSHAEGCQTTASGDKSHAEGWHTTASEGCSHAEGYNATASGEYSHAEGEWTIARGKSSHVQGAYNIEDDKNRYAHIVGNGAYGTRSNAHTLDWNGNAWYQGTVKIGGTSYDDASEVASKTYVDNALGSVSVAVITNDEIESIFDSVIQPS